MFHHSSLCDIQVCLIDNRTPVLGQVIVCVPTPASLYGLHHHVGGVRGSGAHLLTGGGGLLHVQIVVGVRVLHLLPRGGLLFFGDLRVLGAFFGLGGFRVTVFLPLVAVVIMMLMVLMVVVMVVVVCVTMCLSIVIFCLLVVLNHHFTNTVKAHTLQQTLQTGYRDCSIFPVPGQIDIHYYS